MRDDATDHRITGEIEAGNQVRRAALHFFDHPEFRKLDDAAVDEIVSEVSAWYDAMPRSLAS